jgi:hypothetical protein
MNTVEVFSVAIDILLLVSVTKTPPDGAIFVNVTGKFTD